MKPAHIALALIVNLIWGFSFITAKIGIGQFPPLLFTALRFGTVALLLVFYLKPLGDRFKPVLGIAMSMGTVHFSLLYLGISAAGGVSAVAITVQLVAPFSLILAVIFLKVHVGWKRILGVALAFGGVMVIGFDPVMLEQLDGVFLVALAAFSVAYSLIQMRQLKGVGVFELQAWVGAICMPQVMLLSFLFEDNQWNAIVDADLTGWGALFFSAAITTLIAHSSWYYLIQRYTISVLTPFGLLAPVFGVASGVVLLGEPLTTRFVVGALITLGGVSIINLRGKALPPPEPV